MGVVGAACWWKSTSNDRHREESQQQKSSYERNDMSRTRKLSLAVVIGVAAMVAAPLALGAGENVPLDGGARNPSADETQSYSRETEIIADNASYGTRQSNKSSNGGGAIYGCRSGVGGTPTGNEPCIRANNLANGRAFEFVSGQGDEVGRIESTRPNAKPFTTNATGVATGLNADRLDSKSADEIRDEAIKTAVSAMLTSTPFAAVAADGKLGDKRGVASATRTATGTYTVTFEADVSKCAHSVTVVGAAAAGGFGWVESIDAKNLRVHTRQADAGAQADRAFHLTTTC